MSMLSEILYRTPVVDRETLLATRPWAQWIAALSLRVGGAGEVMTLADLALLAQLDVPARPDVTATLAARLDALEAFGPLAGDQARHAALAEALAMGHLDALLPRPASVLADESLAEWSDWHATLRTLTAVVADLEQAILTPAPRPASPAHLLGGPLAPPTVATTAAGAGANATATVAGTDTAGSITLVCSVLDTPGANSTILTVTFAQAFAATPSVLLMPANDAAWALVYSSVRARQADVTTALFTLRSGTVPLPALTAATYIYNYHVVG